MNNETITQIALYLDKDREAITTIRNKTPTPLDFNKGLELWNSLKKI